MNVVQTDNLNNKPLVEAIFELRWNLQENPHKVLVDPHYKLLIGQIYEDIENDYPKHQQLAAANIPEDMAAYVVQHQFRSKDTGWPLIQMGPGVLTLNDTKNYLWKDFHSRIENLISVFLEKYPDTTKELSFNSIILRYIDAEEFDFEKNNLWKFLKDKLKVGIHIHEELFKNNGVTNQPLALDMKFTFPSTSPKGAAHLRFSRGEIDKKSVLIWETLIQTLNKDIPCDLDGLKQWVNDAHNLTHDWFFKMIKGDLLEKYK